MTAHLTPLETAALDALADELRDSLPDLPGQIAESRVGVRRNTGQGFFTEVIVNRARPLPDIPFTGRLGTIHGDVPGLIEPMAFQVEVVAGRLIALHGTTYDEPTGSIDFPTARVTGLFRIDERGNSVAWDPVATLGESPLLALQKSDEPYDPRYSPPPLSVRYDGRPSEPKAEPAPELTTVQEARVSLLIGLWTVIVLTLIVAIVAFRMPIITAAIIGIGLGRLIHQPRVLDFLQKAFDQARVLFDAARARQR